MSIFGFMAQMGIAKAGKLGENITSAIVSFDPITASEAEIAQMDAHCRELAARVSQAEGEEERSHQQCTQIEKELSRTISAAKIIGEQIKTTTDAATVASLNGKLSKLMDAIEAIGGAEGDGSKSGTLYEARIDHAAAEKDLHDWEATHAGAVKLLSTANDRLHHAVHDMERAHQDELKAKERAEQAERDAGLRHGLDSNNVALSAMEAQRAKSQERARAYQINADALKAVGPASTEDIVNATLTEVPQATNPLDRLARLG